MYQLLFEQAKREDRFHLINVNFISLFIHQIDKTAMNEIFFFIFH